MGRGNLVGRQVDHGNEIPGRGGDHRPEDVAKNIGHGDPPGLAGHEVERAGEEQERHGLPVLPEGGGPGVEIGALRRPEEGDAVADGEVGRCCGRGGRRRRGGSGGVRRGVGGLGLLLGAGVGAGGGHEDVVDGAGGHGGGGGGGGEEGEERSDGEEEGPKKAEGRGDQHGPCAWGARVRPTSAFSRAGRTYWREHSIKPQPGPHAGIQCTIGLNNRPNWSGPKYYLRVFIVEFHWVLLKPNSQFKLNL